MKRIPGDKLHNRFLLLILISTTVFADDMIFRNSFEDNREQVQGSASGISSSGLILKLITDVDSELLQVNSNGVFSFISLIEIDTNWIVEIAILPNNPVQQNCQLSNNSGIISNGGVNNLMVSCDAPISKWDEMNWDSAKWN